MRRVRMALFVIWMLLCVAFTDHDASTVLAAQKNGMMITLTQAGQVLDSITYQGITVEAVYTSEAHSGSDPTYSCAAFVKKFYQSAYGINVYNLNSSSSTPLIYDNKGSFMVTDLPQVGDIVRDNNRTHWAIVKEISGDTVTLIQQNYQTGITAWVGCSVDRKDTGYTFFTYSERKQEASTIQETPLIQEAPTAQDAPTNQEAPTILAPQVTETEKTLYTGYLDYKLQLSQLKEDAVVFYSSDHPEIALVNIEGVVTPLQKGEALLYINILQDNVIYTLQVKVTVKEPYIKLSSSKKELNVGKSMTIKIKRYGTQEEVIWQVTDPTIAGINEKTGKLTAKKQGTVTVTVKTAAGLSAKLKMKII